MSFLGTPTPKFLESNEGLGPVGMPRGVISSTKQKQDVLFTTGKTPEEVEILIEAGIPVTVDTPSADDKLEEQPTLKELETSVEMEEAVRKAQENILRYTSSEHAMAMDGEVLPEVFRRESRIERSRDMLWDAAESKEGGTVAKVIELLDQVAYDTYLSYADFLKPDSELARISEEWAVAVATYDDEEFEEFVNGRIASWDDTIFKGEESQWPIIRELQALEYGGYIRGDKEWQSLSNLLVGAEIATLAAPLVKGATAIARAGRSFVGRTKVTGTKTSTEAAKDIIIRGGVEGEILEPQQALPGVSPAIRTNPSTVRGQAKSTTSKIIFGSDIEDAEILEDIVPTFFASRVRPSNTPAPSPVSNGNLTGSWFENSIMRRFLAREQRHSFGASYVKEDAVEWAKNEAKKLSAGKFHRIIDAGIEDAGIQTFKAFAVLGKTDGMPFKYWRTAAAFAKNFDNAVIVDKKGRVVKQIDDTKPGEYTVRVEQPVPTRDFIDDMDLDQYHASQLDLFRRFFGRSGRQTGLWEGLTSFAPSFRSWTAKKWTESKEVGQADFYSNLVGAAEAGTAIFKRDLDDVVRRLKKLKKVEQARINKILTDAYHDPEAPPSDHSWIKPTDFSKKYVDLSKTADKPQGEFPSAAVLEAYEDLVTLAEFSWAELASERLGVLFNKNASLVKIKGQEFMSFPARITNASGRKDIVKTIQELKVDGNVKGKVIDAETGQVWRIKDVPEGQLVRELSLETREGIRYVTNFTGKTRMPNLEDAFPFKAGGSRAYPHITEYVGTSNGGWNTLIGARSAKEGAAAAEEINNILSAYKNTMPMHDSTTLTTAQKRSLDEVVRANNKWNEDIEDLDDFLKFLKERGVSTSDTILHRPKDTKIGEFTDFGDSTYVDLSIGDMVTLGRHDLPLREYGGKPAFKPDPFTAITSQFEYALSRGAMTQYRMQAPTAWVKTFERYIKAGKLSDVDTTKLSKYPMSDENKVFSIDIPLKGGDLDIKRKLRKEQQIIQRRLNHIRQNDNAFSWANESSKYVEDWLSRAYDGSVGLDKWVKGKTEFRYAQLTSDFITRHVFGKSIDFVRGLKGTVSNRAMTVGFATKMTSPDQLVLQSLHVPLMIALSPKNGGRAAILSAWARQAARTGDSGVWETIAKGLGSFMGADSQLIDDIIEHLNASGRGFMRGIVADDPGAGVLMQTPLGKGMDIARIPFYAGENYAQTTSRVAAYLDVMEQFPSLDRKGGLFWNKVQELDRMYSAGLTSSEKSWAQAHPVAKVVGQFTTYPIAIIEQILYENKLSKLQRYRLWASSSILWGTVGAGFYKSGESVYNLVGNNLAADIILNGVDTALDLALGIKFGDRVAQNPFELVERAVGLTKGDIFEHVPVLNIASDANPMQALAYWFTLDFANAMSDTNKVLRAFKGYDNLHLAYTMYMYDIRVSRSGRITDGPFTGSQELLQALGFTPSEVIDAFRAGKIVTSNREKVKKAEKAAGEWMDKAVAAYRMDDMEGFQRNFENAMIHIHSYGLPDYYQRQVKDKVIQRMGNDWWTDTILNLIKMGYPETALKLKELE